MNSFCSKPAGLKEGDLPLLLQISLVANHQDDNGRAGQGSGVGQPVGQTIERLPELDSKLNQTTFSTADISDNFETWKQCHKPAKLQRPLCNNFSLHFGTFPEKKDIFLKTRSYFYSLGLLCPKSAT